MRTKRLFIFAGIACIFMLSAAAAFGQGKRDHLTDKETDVVRDTQEVDKRMEVFVKAIDRRLAVLAGSTADPAKVNNKKPQKNVDGEILDWGDLPQGTHAQLFRDIELILDEAINNIDDIATREPDSKLMMKGVKVLGAACTRLLPQLKSFSEKTTVKEEKQALLNATEYAQSVIDSMGKVPADLEEKESKEKNKKSKKP
ncbi:MAG TPA: hypothetical protein VGO50_14780 [Pyrinomonadaceae bacterium]|jgi:hypothetical protein|nr:hypothetical protein [Pyrinomonadaceae bacterium]